MKRHAYLSILATTFVLISFFAVPALDQWNFGGDCEVDIGKTPQRIQLPSCSSYPGLPGSGINLAGAGSPSASAGAATEQAPSEVTVEAEPTPVTKGTAATFTPSRTGATAEALAVSVGVTETGSMISDTAPTRYYRVSALRAAAVGEASDSAGAMTDPPLPVITVVAESTPVTEGEDALFIVSRAGPAEEGLDVLVEVSATGSLAFTGGPRTVTLRMEPESRIHSYGFAIRRDARNEADRAVTVTVMAPEDASYEVGSPSSATVVVEDNDDLAIDVATAVVDAGGVAVAEVPEGIGAATIRVTATTNGTVAPTETFSVTVISWADTATSPEDYAPLSSMVGFQATEWLFVEAVDSYRAVQDIPLEIVDDSLDEPDRESLRLVTEPSPGGPSYINLPGPISLAIVDDDSVPGAPTALVASAVGQTAIDLSWSAPTEPANPPITGYRIEWSADGRADWTDLVENTGSDATTYTDSGLAAGTTRHYRVSAVNVVGTGLPSASATATTEPVPPPIAAPEMSILPGATPVTEGTAATFILSRTGATAEALTVSVYVTETGSMISDTAPTSVLFGTGDAEATLTVETEADDRDEADSSITATVTAGPDAAYTVGSDSSATVVVHDDDDNEPVVVEPDAPTDLVATAAGETAIDLSWTAPSDTGGSLITGYQVEWSPDGDSDWTELVADTDSDATTYTDSGLAAGTTRHYRVSARNSAGLGSPSDSASATTPSVAPPPIAEPEVTIAAGTTPVDEGTDATFVLSRSGTTAQELTVFVEVTETGSTIRGSTPESVIFGAGDAETTLSLPTVDDSDDEPDSAITATITAGLDAAYTVGSDSSATVAVQDDDDSPVVPDAPTDLRALADEPTRIDLAWTAPVNTGGATITGYRIEWSPDGSGDWAELVADTGSVSTAFSDSRLEAGTTRYYRVCASNAAGVGPPSNPAGATTPIPMTPQEVTISARTKRVEEGANAAFAASRTGSTAEALTVSVEVTDVDGGASVREVRFEAGATAATLLVPTTDDAADEPDSRIVATLQEGDDYILGRQLSATVLVTDNDETPVVSIAGATAPEGARELRFAVTLRGRSAVPVTVDWRTAPGTATAAADYEETSGSLTLASGQTSGTIVVEVLDDALYEENETFFVRLSRPTNATLAAAADSAAGVIENDDGAPVFRIVDASAAESAGEMTFAVTLEGESAMPATVRWTSSAGSAQPGLDYMETSGALTFPPGMAAREVAVVLIEDRLREEAETFRVALTEPTNAVFEGAPVSVAVGTIVDDDDSSVEEAWLARFGRTAASNALEAVEDRLSRGSSAGSQLTVAGHRIDVSGGTERTASVSEEAPVTGLGGIAQASGGFDGVNRFSGGLWDGQPGRYGSGRIGVGDLLARSSFHFSSDSHGSDDRTGIAGNGVSHGGGSDRDRWSVWGRGESTRFGGGEDTVSLDGDVMTGTVGADYERGRALFGVAVSHSRSDGDYRSGGNDGRGAREGDLESGLTTGMPYLRVAVSDRLSVWGVLGRGQGRMTVNEDGVGSTETDIGLNMAALGARRALRSSAGGNGLNLALNTDLLFVQATSDETEALAALSADVSRLRLMIEGSLPVQLTSGARFVPSAELGLRYDAGDAETGSGLEIGAGLQYQSASRGLTAEVTGRSLLTHEAGEFSEWGMGGSLRFDPGAAERGLALGLRSTWGAASGGIRRLWEQQNAGPLGDQAADTGGAMEAEVGYGLIVLGGRGRLVPYLGAGLSNRSGLAYRAGSRLKVGDYFALDAEAARLEQAGMTPAVYRAALLASLRW